MANYTANTLVILINKVQAVRDAIAALPVSTAVNAALSGKANTSHTHLSTQISDSGAAGRSVLTSSSVSGVKTVLALENVDNTSDANKPVSTAQQAAINARTPKIWGPIGSAETRPSGAVAGDIILRRQ